MEYDFKKIDNMLISLEEADRSLELLKNNIVIKNILPTINDILTLESLSGIVYNNYKMASAMVGYNISTDITMEELETFSLDNKIRTLTLSNEGLIGNIIGGIGKAIAAIFKAIFSFIGAILNFFFGTSSNGGGGGSSSNIKKVENVVSTKNNEYIKPSSVEINKNESNDSKKIDKENMLSKIKVNHAISMLLAASRFKSKYPEYAEKDIDLGDIVYYINDKFKKELPPGLLFRNTSRIEDHYNKHVLHLYIGVRLPSAFLDFPEQHFETLKNVFNIIKDQYKENSLTDMVRKSDYAEVFKTNSVKFVDVNDKHFGYLINKVDKSKNVLAISGRHNTMYTQEHSKIRTHLFDVGTLYVVENNNNHSVLDNAKLYTNPPFDIDETQRLIAIAEKLRPNIETLIKDIRGLIKSLETDQKKALEEFNGINNNEKLNRQKLLCDSINKMPMTDKAELDRIAGRLFVLGHTAIIDQIPELIEKITKTNLKSLNNLLKLLADLLGGIELDNLPSILMNKR